MAENSGFKRSDPVWLSAGHRDNLKPEVLRHALRGLLTVAEVETSDKGKVMVTVVNCNGMCYTCEAVHLIPASGGRR